MIRTWAVLSLSLGLALPALVPAQTVERISVDQLEGILAKAQGISDADLATQLSSLQLTERFSSTHIDHWRSSLPGMRSQRALLGLADRSAFLALPASDLPATPAPDLAEQKRIMGLTAAYVGNAIPQLPRFYAARSITHFEDEPGSAHDLNPLRATRISRATVLYRDGQEQVEGAAKKVDTAAGFAAERGLKSWGAFGPILGLVLLDAAQNKLTWSRWEKGKDGPLAVFNYSVAKERSHYEVRYCCVAESYGLESNLFRQMSAYHGEISIDAASGIITRLAIEAEMGPDDPISHAATVVEYGAVELGGKIYHCPVRSVSISIAKTLRTMQDPSGRSWVVMGQPQMLLNDAAFDRYHLFRAETRILSGDEERAAGVAPDATLPPAEATDLQPAEEELVDASTAKPAEVPTETAAETPAAANGETPEISTSIAKGLPEVATRPAEESDRTQPASFTLRVNSRLVDVNVVALDKRGHPITGLQQSDFEVYDNGVKQDVRSFMKTEAEAPAEAAAEGTPDANVAKEFSNHAAIDPRAVGAGANTTVLLMDGSNLSFYDFADARQQVTHFLRTLPPGERVALYAMRYHSYQVLQEATTDHDTIATTLAKWMPTAQDMANAQDEEQRNRQQIETVQSPEDLLSVNGNNTLDNGTQTEALDPKLRELGSKPGPIALNILAQVAHHLSSMAGHKNLVWVTSDNALADWNKLSFNLDKGSRNIEPIALRTQEAMNQAHVTVYPLDASRLEANVVGADMGRRGVVLTPTFERNQALESPMEGPEIRAGQDINVRGGERDFGGAGHLMAQAQQDEHAISGVFREVADATGGRVFRRSSNLVGELDSVMADSHATYLLGFTPAQPADEKYHMLTVKLAGHKDAMLRFRSGYQYDKEASTLKERFNKAVWDPTDTSEIGVTTKIVADASGSALRVTVAGSDLTLTQQNAAWAGKVDIFLVRRDQEALRAKVTGLTVGLHLKQPTYERAIKDGLTFDERLDSKAAMGSLRVVVVDVNSGRIGSVTVPTAALMAQR